MIRKSRKDSAKSRNAIMFAAWEGVGKAGYLAAEFLIKAMDARPAAEIDSSEYIYPSGIIIENNVIKQMIFPESIFYSAEYQGKNFIIFPGKFQFPITKEMPASSNPAYQYACKILDAAESLGCREIFTAGGIFTMIHHSMDSGTAWGSNDPFKMTELNMTLSGEYGLKDILHPKTAFITGMNGILPYAASDRELTASILLGEVPIYLQSLPSPYPKASKSILKSFAAATGITFDYQEIDAMIKDSDREIETLMSNFKSSLPPKERRSIFKGIELLKKKPDFKNLDKVFEDIMENRDVQDNEGLSEICENGSPLSDKSEELTQEDVKQAIVDIESFFRQENDK